MQREVLVERVAHDTLVVVVSEREAVGESVGTGADGNVVTLVERCGTPRPSSWYGLLQSKDSSQRSSRRAMGVRRLRTSAYASQSLAER